VTPTYVHFYIALINTFPSNIEGKNNSLKQSNFPINLTEIFYDNNEFLLKFNIKFMINIFIILQYYYVNCISIDDCFAQLLIY